jgi:hypothetical protein
MKEKYIEILFSEKFDKRYREKISNNNKILEKSYLIGAYSKAIIHSSWTGGNPTTKVVSKNITFKKWLSNQQITFKNLKKIFIKAQSFERKFHLDTKIIQDLSNLVTENGFDKNLKGILNQDISFAFIQGFNDFNKLKEENTKNREKFQNKERTDEQ